MQRFVDSIVDGTPVPVPPEEGLAVIETMQSILEQTSASVEAPGSRRTARGPLEGRRRDMSRKSRRRQSAVPNGRRPPPQARPGGWTAYLNPSRYWLLAVLAGVAAYRFVVLADQPAPPGADPGNWLAFTHQLFGTPVKAAASVYFPVIPVLLKALLAFMPALMATKVLGVGVSVAMGIPFYLILRRGCSPLLSAGLTLAFLLAGYQEEVLIFGGYPQLLATTFLLFTVYWLMDGLISGRLRPLLLAAASTALVAGTHHFTLLLMPPTLLVLGAALFIQERPPIRPFLRNAGVWALARGRLHAFPSCPGTSISCPSCKAIRPTRPASASST